MKRFIWSCTKFLASLLLVLIGIGCWSIGETAFWVALGYVLVLYGMANTIWVYARHIRPALKGNDKVIKGKF